VDTFTIVLRGYNRTQVDELIARIDGTLGRGPATARPVTAADIRAAQFVRVMRGYAPDEVDQALAAAERELRQRFP
jgi:DivIVA domain-containing protein